jgi:Family of unknown function (DUF6325)
MAEFEHGPMEYYLIGFSGERPGPEVVGAILDLVRAGTIRVCDLVFARRSQDGGLTVLEMEDVAGEWGFTDLEPDELGLVGENDINELADTIDPGTSAAILVVEHRWARNFAQALANAGGVVLATAQVPASEVEDLLAAVNA